MNKSLSLSDILLKGGAEAFPIMQQLPQLQQYIPQLPQLPQIPQQQYSPSYQAPIQYRPPQPQIQQFRQPQYGPPQYDPQQFFRDQALRKAGGKLLGTGALTVLVVCCIICSTVGIIYYSRGKCKEEGSNWVRWVHETWWMWIVAVVTLPIFPPLLLWKISLIFLC